MDGEIATGVKILQLSQESDKHLLKPSEYELVLGPGNWKTIDVSSSSEHYCNNGLDEANDDTIMVYGLGMKHASKAVFGGSARDIVTPKTPNTPRSKFAAQSRPFSRHTLSSSSQRSKPGTASSSTSSSSSCSPRVNRGKPAIGLMHTFLKRKVKHTNKGNKEEKKIIQDDDEDDQIEKTHERSSRYDDLFEVNDEGFTEDRKRILKLIKKNACRIKRTMALHAEVKHIEKTGSIPKKEHQKLDEKRKNTHNHFDGMEVWVETGWLHRRKKGPSRLDSRAQYNQMKKWYAFLDGDGSGTVDVDDILDPLISLGVAKSREDVIRLLEIVSTDDTQGISFDEFLYLVSQRKPKNPSSSNMKTTKEMLEAQHRMSALFQNLSDGTYGDKDLSFPLLATAHRRRMLLNANCAPKDSPEYLQGHTILTALHDAKVLVDDAEQQGPSVTPFSPRTYLSS